jgi:hypothetical protein
MEIRIEPHTIERAKERGASKEEIIETIENGFAVDAKYEKRGKGLIKEYNETRNGKQYEQKKIEVYYLEENNIIITITVYVFYGKFIK